MSQATTTQQSLKPNQRIIEGRRAGVQSCDDSDANVFVEMDGRTLYVQIDFDSGIVQSTEKTSLAKEAVQFVSDHLDEYADLCRTQPK